MDQQATAHLVMLDYQLTPNLQIVETNQDEDHQVMAYQTAKDLRWVRLQSQSRKKQQASI